MSAQNEVAEPANPAELGVLPPRADEADGRPAAEVVPDADKIAQAAASGLRTSTDVDDAAVSIDGPRDAPQLAIDCVVAEEGDLPRAAELTTMIHKHIETMLNVTFENAEVTVRGTP
ncbi:hypothetical protein [Citricoccus alkalitolerans]|uniref:Asp23/Gls24 family envelope stress response protein n=1 Tax=Citricoccus alkalitolerans TaxID=246603 RepID=A0ABV8Y177_9MICC